MKTFMSFTAMISFTVMANLFMKIGADSLNPEASLWVRFLSWRLLLGLACFGCAALIYIAILGWLPLNVAQSFAAAQFVAVVVASRLILFERIGPIQWCGILLIAVGIAIVGWSR